MSSRAERREATWESKHDPDEGKFIFDMEKLTILDEGLARDIEFSSSFSQDYKDGFFSLPPGGMREIMQNIADCLRSIKHGYEPINVSEFTLQLYEDNRIRLFPDKKVIEFGMVNLRPKNLLETRSRIADLMKLWAEKEGRSHPLRIEGSATAEVLGKVFEKECESVRKKVKRLEIAPGVRQKLTDIHEIETFFKNLRIALGINPDSGETFFDISSFHVDISTHKPLGVTLNEIELNPSLLTDGTVHQTAEKIRSEIGVKGTTSTQDAHDKNSPEGKDTMEAADVEKAADRGIREKEFNEQEAFLKKRFHRFYVRYELREHIIAEGSTEAFFANLEKALVSISDIQAQEMDIVIKSSNGVVSQNDLHTIMLGWLDLSDDNVNLTKEKIDGYIKEMFPEKIAETPRDTMAPQPESEISSASPTPEGNTKPAPEETQQVLFSDLWRDVRDKYKNFGIIPSAVEAVIAEGNAVPFFENLERLLAFIRGYTNAEFEVDLHIDAGSGVGRMLGGKTIAIGFSSLLPPSFDETKDAVEEIVKEMVRESPVVNNPNSDLLKPTPALGGSETDLESPVLNLEEARDEYARVYREFLSKHPEGESNVLTCLNIGGDRQSLDELAAARAAYDAALKAAAQEIRDRELNQNGRSGGFHEAKARARANKEIIQRLVIDEEKLLAEKRAVEWPVREQGRWERAWKAYARLPRTTKMVASLAIGTAIAASTGAATAAVGAAVAASKTAVLLYAGRRGASMAAGAGAGAVTTSLFELQDRTFGKKNTKEYKIEALKNRTEDISENMDDMMRAYATILQQESDRQKKRTYLKIGIAVLAGAGAGALASGELHSLIGGDTHPAHTPIANRNSHGRFSESLDRPHRGSHHTADTHEDQEITPPPPPSQTTNLPVENKVTAAAPEQVVEVKNGDSVWKITAHELQNDSGFSKLNEAQKTWVLSTLTNRALEHHTTVGFGNANSLVEYTKLNLSEILKTDDVNNLVHRAEHLAQAKQDNILNNNHAIVNWLKGHPGKPLTEAQTDEIIRAREAAELHAGQLHANIPDTASIRQSIDQWDTKDIAQSTRLVRELENIDRMPKVERAAVLSALAEKVGDRSGVVNLTNAAEVSARMKDYLVAYPEAKHFGFNSYGEYAGIKDMTVKQVIDQMPPMNDQLPFALRHTTFNYKPGYFTELRNGKLHTVPLKRSYVQLAWVLEKVATGKDAGKTISQMFVEHGGLLERSAAAAKRSVSRILNRELVA